MKPKPRKFYFVRHLDEGFCLYKCIPCGGQIITDGEFMNYKHCGHCGLAWVGEQTSARIEAKNNWPVSFLIPGYKEPESFVWLVEELFLDKVFPKGYSELNAREVFHLVSKWRRWKPNYGQKYRVRRVNRNSVSCGMLHQPDIYNF